MESEDKQYAAKNKVSSSTQVEPEHVGDIFRDVIGHTDISTDFLSSSRNSLVQDVNSRKQNKGVRPPGVGQASSSSNDSVSTPFGRRNSNREGIDQNRSLLDRNMIDADDIDHSLGNINYTRGSFSSAPLLNRDDYINQRPPEGSSEQEGVGVLQPLETIQDFPRAQSPSSASSVTSGRPLEWDSLADVGYSNGKPGNSDGLSSLERIVLAFGTGLLTRSDPEGTTAPSGLPQPVLQNQPNFKTKQIGFPKAQSTPMGTCVTSDVSPETVSEDVISPISCDKEGNSSYSNDDVRSSDSGRPIETNLVKEGFQHETLVQAKVTLHGKLPLFPEIINSLPVNPPEKDDLRGMSRPKSNTKISSKNKKQYDKGHNNSLSSSNKKLSSSLENITALPSTKSDVKNQSNTLPRSQSQSNVHEDNLSGTNIGNIEKFPQYSMALHSLIQYNKSASSSSIATVVHRKGDSPKHNMFAQTSAMKQETVGVQVSEKDMKDGFPGKPFVETPHLPKAVQQTHQPKKSNYFTLESTNQAQNYRNGAGSHQNFKSIESCNDKANSNVHFHNGVPCTGAHRKPSNLKNDSKISISSSQSQHTRNNINSNYNNSPLINLNKNNPVTYGSSDRRTNNVDEPNYGTNTLESVESSARSGGCWTDKQYSVTVEDRVNSFEYLPGHVYENNERQQPMDSRATSSISIENQTSNNETPDNGDKMWDSSESVSSTIDKYAERGVAMFSEFVKGSCPNNSAMKKKLIRKVVEKLISKNYNDDQRVGPVNLSSNVPWVPSLPQNTERNGRETRRSVNRSKVPCEFSSRSEKSGSTNASSECFIPCPAASSSVLPSSLRENSNAPAGKVSHSSTSEISIEKSSKTQGKPPQPLNSEIVLLKENESKSDHSTILSDKVPKRGDWRDGPVTKSEKILEELKSKKSPRGNQNVEIKLEEYLKVEQENQLYWIRSQIQHLNNFKELLEKQKDLKQRVRGSWMNSQKSARKSVLKNKNADRLDGGQEKPVTNQTSDFEKKASSLRRQSNYQPTLGAWLEKVTDDSKVNTTVSSAVSTDHEIADWTSHHYKSEYDEHMKSCGKKKSKNRYVMNDKKIPEENNRNHAIYDEPPLNSFRAKSEELKSRRPPSTPYHKASNKFDVNNASASENEGISKSAHCGMGEETSQPHAAKVNKRSEAQRKVSCVCKGSCQCVCHSSQKKNDLEAEKAKEPVGYYITFEPSPRPRDKSSSNQQSRHLEEVRIPVPMSEPKRRPPRRPKTRLGIREDEEMKVNTRSSESEREKPDRVGGSETETASSHSDKENDRPNSGRPIYKGGMGSLQECLLRNRPVYVSRAEDRRQCIAQMQYLRELRDQSKRRLMSLTEPTVAEVIPPPPLSVRRVFSQQTMRRQTEKKYRQLAEVKGKQLDAKRKEGYRTNRQMAEIFTKKLQKRVLHGEVNLSNSVSVISSL